MSQGKKDKFLPVFFGALGVATLGLGFLAYSANSDADEAEQAYNTKLDELKALENAPISRTDANAEKKQELVEAYVAKVMELDSSLQAFQVPIKDITADVFQRELKKTMDEFAAAAKAKQVKIPANFDFGMTKYLSTMAADTAPQLNAQLQALVFLTNSALDAGILEINSLVRPEQDFESQKPADPKGDDKAKQDEKAKKAAAAAKAAAAKDKNKKPVKETAPVLDESSTLQRQPLTLTLTGKNDSILKFLQIIANTTPEKPYFFVIRTLKLENEAKDGPAKNVDVKEEEKADPDNKDAPPIKYNAAYVLGFEKVMVQLELDLVRFVPEVLDTKAADKGTPAKTAASKPSDKGETAPEPAK